ncbi:hypothetical protein N665_0030s0102 [Sinapis alba]|nr:hypothetical protein N665_0030s0102 [Sinapis alba]
MIVTHIEPSRRKRKRRPSENHRWLYLSSDFPSVSESTLVVGSEIYVIGGPLNTEHSCPSSAIHCRTHKRRDAHNMIEARRHAITCFYDGKIYVMGRCGFLEEPWAEVFDTNTQTWASACVMNGVWYFIGYSFCSWTRDGGNWKGVKGNGGSSRNNTKLVSCGGKLLLMWEGYMWHNLCSNRKKIWYAEFTMKTDEVLGNVEWIDVVQSVPTQCELLHCLCLIDLHQRSV